MFIILLLTIFILCFIILQVKKYSALENIPGPSTWGLLKIYLFSKSNEDIFKHILSLFHTHGPIVKLWIKPFRPLLLVADKRIFRQILGSKEHLHRPPIYDILKTIFGETIACAKDLQRWKADRKLLAPLFNTKSVLEQTNRFVSHAEKLVSFFESKENQCIDIQSIINRFTLDIIVDYVICDDVSEQERISDKIINALETYQEIHLKRAYSLYKIHDFIFKFTADYHTWVTCGKIIHNSVKNFAKHISTKKSANAKQSCYQILHENGYSDDLMADNLKTFIIAGYETTAQALSFTLYHIAKNQDLQNKLLDEYLHLFNDQGKINIDNLHHLNYTESVIKESLRMYPPGSQLQRSIKATVKIDDITIPAGTDIMFSIGALHKSSEYYENPNTFDPERFLPANVTRIPPYAFVPFACGPRDCIGRTLAMIEMKILISCIIGKFTIHEKTGHEIDLCTEITMKSKNGMPIIFKKRY